MENKLVFPPEIVDGIKAKCLERTGKYSITVLKRDLKKFVSKSLKELNKSLYDIYFESEIENLEPDTIRRALNGRPDKGITISNNGKLPDLLCLYGFERTYEKTLTFLNIPQNGESPSVPVSKYFQFIDIGFWERMKTLAVAEKETLLSRYYTHSDSSLKVKAVALGDYIIEPSEFFQVFDSDGQEVTLSFSQILDTAMSQSLSLIKILADGGTGKSTFLYWIAKNYYRTFHVFNIKKMDESIVEEFISFGKKIQDTSSRPFIILIDDAASSETVKHLEGFIVEIKDRVSFLNQFIFILAERTSRFNTQFNNKNIENEFSGAILTLVYKAPDKLQIFEKIYTLLEKDNPGLNNEDLRLKSKRLFLNSSIKSISESLFLLLDDLNLKNVIRYDFDWDDWNKFIERQPEYKDLRYLFVAVACFYQFGIRLGITFKSSFLKNANREMILDALSTFSDDTSPIVLDDDNNFLSLKHEYVASWFMRNGKNQLLVQGFFRDFLNSIDSAVPAKLLRKIRQIFYTDEFKKSCISNELTLEKYLAITDSYLELKDISDDEREKMLTEKGIVLVKLNNIDAAITVFKSHTEKYPQNNYSKDQLAMIYSRNPQTYQLAIDYYHQILLNKGYYALIQIKKLLQQGRRHLLNLSFNDDLEFNLSVQENLINEFAQYRTVLQHNVIKEFIKQGELTFAEKLIKEIKITSRRTGECYFMLAKAFIYSNENISKKRELFLKSMYYCNLKGTGSTKYVFRVEYAIFLFTIREFSKSTNFMRRFLAHVPKEDQNTIYLQYIERLRSTKRLFFSNIPNSRDVELCHKYYSKHCQEAAALISSKQTNVETILKGYLLLETVKSHCKTTYEDIYFSTLIQLSYCHMMHAHKQWNNFSVRENKIIAESYFDLALREGAIFSHRNYMNMIHNLLTFNEKSKSLKALVLCNTVLTILENQKIPAFYRYRGTAKKHCGNFDGAMTDYYLSLQCLESFYPKNIKDFNNEMTYLFNDMALLICECVEKDILVTKFRINIAEFYAAKAAQYRPTFEPLKDTLEWISRLKI